MSRPPDRSLLARPADAAGQAGDRSGTLAGESASGRRGILLIGHGTRDLVGTAEFFALADRLGQQVRPLPLQACLLELQPPTIAAGWQALVGQGVTHIHAVPLLLFAAGHAKTDIPQALAACQQGTPEVTWDLTRPLSRCPEVLALVTRRLDQVLPSNPRERDRTALVIVGRGSYDPCAQADLKVLAHCIGILREVRRVEPAFFAMATPRLPEVLAQVAADREIEHLIVQPHLLFDGAIYQGIGRLVEHSQTLHPRCRHRCGRYLGPEAELASALVRRIQELRPQS